ncbi:conserved hypothetical protein [Tenacibaculum maritimum]|uniref:Smr/MutS family protein n=1 Tax=Tenacibaculum maritimum TaxID=107401 RepID=UPI0012E46EF4|nr:Smr/MutS family protein [Tenacibaculum maritimum]CAA0234390.1 conserved hypothetical protein [Tenacibaculum maritimum]
MGLEIGNKVAAIDDVVKGVVAAVEKDVISVESNDGMVYKFDKAELVKIEIEQYELTKYSDINNKLLKEKVGEKKNKKVLFAKRKQEIIMEVDLHISKLVKSSKGMGNYDMLSIQLEEARRKIEYCIRKRISKVIFIHGVGEGVLKSELQYLFNKYPVEYYDAAYHKYGLGATEVYIYQNSNEL